MSSAALAAPNPALPHPRLRLHLRPLHRPHHHTASPPGTDLSETLVTELPDAIFFVVSCFVIVELAGSKDTTTILQRLNKCFPVADDEEQAGLQDLLGATVRRSPAQTRAGQFDADSATALTRPGAGRDRTSGSSRRASRRSPRATCRSWASS